MTKTTTRLIAATLSVTVAVSVPSVGLAQEGLAAPQVQTSTTSSTTTSTTYATTTAVTSTMPAPMAPSPLAPTSGTWALPTGSCATHCEPVEVVTRYEMKPRYGLVITGATVFGALYVITALPMSMVKRDPTLALPIVGPFILASQLNGSGNDIFKFWLAMDGIAQASMLTMAIVGALSKRKTPVLERMVLLPTAGPNGAGLTAAGRF